MKVKELIKQLKKMPQNMRVFYSAHDNSEHEIGGDVNSVSHCIKEDLREQAEARVVSKKDMDWFESNPDEWVIIHG